MVGKVVQKGMDMGAAGIRFLLNDQQVDLADMPADAMLLDFLRETRRLTGTKEGCNEGDCGACTVLIGQLRDGQLHYAPMNACIRFLAQVDGCHVVTIEHLRGPGGALHPVQQAMLDHHASQCGFCTPGIVMALYALWMVHPLPTSVQVKVALQGNLCRCTGYAPILRAAQDIAGDPAGDFLAAERTTIIQALQDMAQDAPAAGAALRPRDLDQALALRAAHPDAVVVAGATDVGLWVNKHLRPMPQVLHLSQIAGFDRITQTADAITIGAGASYAQAAPVLAAAFPALGPYLDRIAGAQVRSAGTIGGNIANGSPIGDMPPVLIALGARITLQSQSGVRDLPIEDFFIDYGKQDLRPDELLTGVTIPLHLASGAATNNGHTLVAQKLSKRRDDDISAVSLGMAWVLDGDRMGDVRIAMGGMGPIPARARAAEVALEGATFTAAAFDAAARALAQDFQPISDMRASADYRMMAAQNLIRRVYLHHTGAAQSNLERVI